MIPKKIIEEYFELKKEAEDGVLLMQVGLFFKIIGVDTIHLEEVLKVTEVAFNGEVLETCGFPGSALDKYIGKLVRKGLTVAIAPQIKNNSRSVNEIIRIQ